MKEKKTFPLSPSKEGGEHSTRVERVVSALIDFVVLLGDGFLGLFPYYDAEFIKVLWYQTTRAVDIFDWARRVSQIIAKKDLSAQLKIDEEDKEIAFRIIRENWQDIYFAAFWKIKAIENSEGDKCSGGGF